MEISTLEDGNTFQHNITKRFCAATCDKVAVLFSGKIKVLRVDYSD